MNATDSLKTLFPWLARAGRLALVLTACLMCPVLAAADPVAAKSYRASDLKGEWVFSGLIRFGAPVPIPALVVDGAPPHAQVAPGEVVGVWATIVGTVQFDGEGNVVKMEDVVKTGELVPLPPVPFDALPPFPEVGAGTYDVSDSGMVNISITGRDPGSPEGQVDFETDYVCVLNRMPREMKCTFARFVTYFVDPQGYSAPITGEITFTARH